MHVLPLALLLAAPSFAENISGRVYDPSGAVVAGARVVLLTDFNKINETQSNGQGDFLFKDLQPGTYQVQVKKPFLQIFQQIVTLRAGESARIYATPAIARAETEISITGNRPPNVQPSPGVPKQHATGANVTGLKRLGGRMPSWPKPAVDRGVSGPVVLLTAVTPAGNVGDIIVLESPDPDIEREAIAAAKTWTFEPMKLNGQPVECRHVFVFNYSWSSAQPSPPAQ